jgi:potassium voltage-gated channel Shal-related subfamily D member 2
MAAQEAAIPLTRIRTASNFLNETSEPLPSPSTVDDIFRVSTQDADTIIASIFPPWKRDLFALMEQPTSSGSAFLLHVLITCLIVISAIITVLETVPAFHTISIRFWFGLETSIVTLFTVEYIARTVAWSGTGWIGLFKWIFCGCLRTLVQPPCG